LERGQNRELKSNLLSIEQKLNDLKSLKYNDNSEENDLCNPCNQNNEELQQQILALVAEAKNESKNLNH